MSKRRRDFRQFDSPWIFDPGTIRMQEPGDDVSDEEACRRLRTGELRRPFILETDAERHLHFAHGSVQSTMRLDEPDALICAYTRKMMAFLLFNPDPQHIVMIGLGGGSLPKFCYRHLRSTQITVVEINADVIALRDEFSIPADDQRFRIVHDDGARYVATLAGPVDVLLVDAFDAVGIAPSLATSDFYSQAAARLAPDGVLVMNLSGECSRYAVHIKRIRAVFGNNMVLVPVTASENVLLFAFKTQGALAATAELEPRAHHLQSRFPLEFPRYLRRICQGHLLSSATA